MKHHTDGKYPVFIFRIKKDKVVLKRSGLRAPGSDPAASRGQPAPGDPRDRKDRKGPWILSELQECEVCLATAVGTRGPRPGQSQAKMCFGHRVRRERPLKSLRGVTSSAPVTEYACPFTSFWTVTASESAMLVIWKRGENQRGCRTRALPAPHPSLACGFGSPEHTAGAWPRGRGRGGVASGGPELCFPASGAHLLLNRLLQPGQRLNAAALREGERPLQRVQGALTDLRRLRRAGLGHSMERGLVSAWAQDRHQTSGGPAWGVLVNRKVGCG